MKIILLVVPDLFFATKIEDVAKRLDYVVDSIRAREGVSDAIARVRPTLVVLSLDAPNWRAVVDEAKRANVKTLAFGSHMNVELMQTAREAGCAQVVARSLMSSDLPNLLKKWTN